MTDTSDHITCEKIFLRVTVLGTVLDFIEKIIVGRHRAHEQTKQVDETETHQLTTLRSGRRVCCAKAERLNIGCS